MSENLKQPIQPIYLDEYNTFRFKKNAIVRFLLDAGGFDLNKLAVMDFSNEDREQFAQLIGYSLGGFEELSYTSSETVKAATLMAEQGHTEAQARIESLEDTLNQVREGLRLAAASVFNIHPDDLVG